MSTNCTNVKLSPISNAKISFPGYQKISDTTFDGSTSTLAVTVNSDTDLEYMVIIDNKIGNFGFFMRFNNDSGANYQIQQIKNNAGTVSAVQTATATDALNLSAAPRCLHTIFLSTPSGFLKSMVTHTIKSSAGTTAIDVVDSSATTWNSSANITSLNFAFGSGNFTSGVRVIVYVRRS